MAGGRSGKPDGRSGTRPVFLSGIPLVRSANHARNTSERSLLKGPTKGGSVTKLIANKTGLEIDMERGSTIIGYFAATNRGDVVCDGPACIITGSYKTMKDYLAKSRTKPPVQVRIIKTRFSEIIAGMRVGAAYSFDAESYGRFLPLAREEGMDLDDADFTPDKAGDVRLLTITPTGA